MHIGIHANHYCLRNGRNLGRRSAKCFPNPGVMAQSLTRVSISKNLEKKLLFIFSLAPVSHDTSIILLGWAHFHLRFLHISQIGVFGSDLDPLGPKTGHFWGHRREKRPRSHESLLRFIPWSFPDSCNIKPSRASQNGDTPPPPHPPVLRF